ncbi:MAG: acetyltransferase [Bdellovibrionales bacterium GWA2_49_15]|nr:MAG: acetyltransferase [Bdellovibrionales bacterium GWA2_49_15]
MLFNSHEFILAFFPITFLGYLFFYRTCGFRNGKIWLVCCSLVFYAWSNWNFLFLITLSIFGNYIHNRLLFKTSISQRKRRIIFATGLAFNLGLLGYYKYTDFFIENINAVFGANLPLWKLVLPLGISFYTLQQIGFLIDAYDGLIKKVTFIDYGLFVTFFPQLIVGPIVHQKEMLPQFKEYQKPEYKNIVKGIYIFSIGLFKKIVLADTFAVWATNGFDKASSLSFIDSWLTSLSYTFQLYFDFSGYSDMAIGLALCFNIRIPTNFNSPYLSRNIIEFWQRWHITLSDFIMSYVYTPIIRSFTNITFAKILFTSFITMMIVGFWHGASWSFILFGALHGAALALNHFFKKKKIKLNRYLSWFITFNFVNITLVIFRGNNFSSIGKVLRGMLGLGGIVLPYALASHLSFLSRTGITFGSYLQGIAADATVFAWLVVGFCLIIFFKNSNKHLEDFSPSVKTFIVGLILFYFSILQIGSYSEFLYFKF